LGYSNFCFISNFKYIYIALKLVYKETKKKIVGNVLRVKNLKPKTLLKLKEGGGGEWKQVMFPVFFKTFLLHLLLFLPFFLPFFLHSFRHFFLHLPLLQVPQMLLVDVMTPQIEAQEV